MLELVGSPVGGENPPHDRIWRQRIAAEAAGHAPARAVNLHFRLEEHRRVDLDNLVRPALAGLRDAGVFGRGFRNLDVLLATKSVREPVGLTVQTDDDAWRATISAPGPTLLRAESSLLPRDGDRESKLLWRECVRRAYQGRPIGETAWVAVEASTDRSLEALMKPVIDGLEPFLGRDSRGRLDFVPNDDLVVHLTTTRHRDLPMALAVTAGTIG